KPNPTPTRRIRSTMPAPSKAITQPRKRKRVIDADATCADAPQVNKKNRFVSGDGAELSAAEVAFGATMHRYLGRRVKAGWTCGEVLDVLMSLGYCNAERDFEACVHRFTLAVEQFKQKGRRPFPAWREVLAVAAECGWRRM